MGSCRSLHRLMNVLVFSSATRPDAVPATDRGRLAASCAESRFAPTADATALADSDDAGGIDAERVAAAIRADVTWVTCANRRYQD